MGTSAFLSALNFKCRHSDRQNLNTEVVKKSAWLVLHVLQGVAQTGEEALKVRLENV